MGWVIDIRDRSSIDSLLVVRLPGWTRVRGTLRRLAMLAMLSVVVIPGVGAADTPPVTVTSSELLRTRAEAFSRLDGPGRQAVADRLPVSMIDYSLLDDGLTWYRHAGDLHIDGSFDNTDALVIDGDLTISGNYDDYEDGIGLLVVLGDMHVGHLTSWGSVAIGGSLYATGLVHVYYNDFTFEVGESLSAQALVIDDRAYDIGSIDAPLVQDSFNDTNGHEALRRFVADVMIHSLGYPDELEWSLADYGVTRERIRAGQPVLREIPAPAALIDDLERVLDWEAEVADLDALASRDRLLAMVVALRDDIPKSLQERLVAEGDPGVLAMLAYNPIVEAPLLAAMATVSGPVADAVAQHANTPEAAIAAMVRDDLAAVRRAALARGRLPVSLLADLADDQALDVRQALVTSEHLNDLPNASIERLSRDADHMIRERIAGFDGIDAAVLKRLASDAEEDVRRAAADALARQATFRATVTVPTDQREALALALWADASDAVRSAAIPALPAEAQARIAETMTARSERWAIWSLVEHTRSEALMLRYAHGLDMHFRRALAGNVALTPAVQQVLVAQLPAADARVSIDSPFPNAWDAAEGSVDDVIDALIENPNATSQTLLALATYCREARAAAPPCKTLLRRYDLKPAVLEALEGIGPMEYRQTWAYSVLRQAYATPAQLKRALNLWAADEVSVETTLILAAFAPLAGKDGQAFWDGLAQSPHSEVRALAAANAATAPQRLAQLAADPDEWVVTMAAMNPATPAEALQHVAADLRREPAFDPQWSDAQLQALLAEAKAAHERLFVEALYRIVATRALRAF